jgi:hypothetical protein
MWVFTAPAGATIAGGSLVVSLTAPQGTAAVLTPANVYDAADVLINCQFNQPCGGQLGGAELAVPVAISHPGGTQIFAEASCVGPGPGQDCAAGGGANGVNSLIAVSQSNIELTAQTTPSASAFSGTLLAPNAVGVATLQFTASEPAPGPGIETVKVLIDGAVAYSGIPDGNGGKCAPIGTDAAGVAEYTSLTPCALSTSIALPIDVSDLADGEHHLTVAVTDAAGVTQKTEQTITTTNRTTVSAALAKGRPAAPGAPGAAGGGGPCNASCDPHAILQPAAEASAKTPTVDYAHSALALSGRLLDHTGAGMAGAQVELRQRSTAAGAADSLVATATTTATGAWTFNVPPGPSRQLVVGYRAHLGDPAFAAQLISNQAVLAAATLSAPRRTRPGVRIFLRGQLAGGNIPAGGEPVAVEIHYGPRWRTIAVVRTNQAGRWRYGYTFALPPGSYRFRSVPIAGPAYPFGPHASKSRSIEVL